MIGLWLKSLFVTPIAQMVRQEPFVLRTALRASVATATQIALLFLSVIGMVALMLIPVAIVGVAFVLAGINGFGLLILAVLVPVFGALFYGAFAMDAIFLERVGPMRAIYLSYRVVRRNVWPTAGFIALTILISRGVPLALTRVVQQPGRRAAGDDRACLCRGGVGDGQFIVLSGAPGARQRCPAGAGRGGGGAGAAGVVSVAV